MGLTLSNIVYLCLKCFFFQHWSIVLLLNECYFFFCLENKQTQMHFSSTFAVVRIPDSSFMSYFITTKP